MAYKKPTPKIRENKEIEIRSDLTNLVHKYLRTSDSFKNCLNCTHWNLGQDICGKYNAKPPTDVLIYSCDSHEDNQEIPF